MVVTGMKVEDGVFLNFQDLTEFTIKCNPLRVFQTECPEAPLFPAEQYGTNGNCLPGVLLLSGFK